MTEPPDTHWHLSKRISVETVVLMLCQTIAVVWFASKMDSRVESLEDSQVTALAFIERITKLEMTVQNLGQLVQIQSSVINRIDRKIPNDGIQ
jgi:hypothetical protein